MSLVGRKGAQVQILPPDIPRGHEPLVGVKLQLFNRRMRKRREECNLSQGELGRQTGVTQTLISAIETFRVVPTIEQMNLIATALNDEPDHMFPEAIRERKRIPLPELYLSTDGIRAFEDEIQDETAALQVLAPLLSILTPRERLVVEDRFGLVDAVPKNLDLVSEHLGVTRDRARQIEATALEKMYGRAVWGRGETIRCLCRAEIIIKAQRNTRKLNVQHGKGGVASQPGEGGVASGGFFLYGREGGELVANVDEIMFLLFDVHDEEAWAAQDTSALEADLAAAYDRVLHRSREAAGE